MADKYVLENGSGSYQLEDASGVLLLEASVAGSIVYRFPLTTRIWPKPYPASLLCRDYGSLLVTTLAPVSFPFFQDDWPVPKGAQFPQSLRGFADPLKLNLIGQDKFFRDSGMGPTYDYPNPRGYVPNIGLKTWADPAKLNLIGQDRFFGLAGNPTFDWPNPGHFQPRSRWQPVVDLKTWTKNLVTTTLLGKDQLPYNQDDWPVPKGPRTHDLRTWVQSLVNNVLLGQDTLPKNQFNWPNPGNLKAKPDWISTNLLSTLFSQFAPFFQTNWPNPRGYTPATDLKTWIESLVNTTLLGQDEFFRAAVITKTWPKAYPTALLHQERANLLTTLLLQAAPFFKTDWPNPRGYTPATDLKTWFESLVNTTLVGQDQLPGNQYSWPNPRGIRANPDWASTNLLTTLLSFQVPFFLTDWPNPKGAQFPSDLRTWIDQLKRNLTGQDLLPFHQLEWLVPKGGSPTLLRTWIDPTKILLIGKDTLPQLQHDWPVPKGAVPGITLKTLISSLVNTILKGQDQLPYNQDDWPVPKGSTPSILLKTWAEQLKLNLIGQDQFFGLAGNPTFDWPVPKGKIPATSLKTWTWDETLKLFFQVATTFFGLAGNPNFDWPVPKGKIPSITLKTWVDQFKRNLVGQDQFFDGPGRAPVYDYPNPRGYVPNISLKTWADQTKILLIGQDKFFGLAGHPTFDWPVPKGAAYPSNMHRSYQNMMAQFPPSLFSFLYTYTLPLLAIVAGRTSMVTDVQYDNLSAAVQTVLDDIIGGRTYTYVTIEAPYAILPQDYTIECVTNSFTITLPTAAGSPGKIYVLKNSGPGVITVATTGGELIDGITPQSIPSGNSMVVQATGVPGWIII